MGANCPEFSILLFLELLNSSLFLYFFIFKGRGDINQEDLPHHDSGPAPKGDA